LNCSAASANRTWNCGGARESIDALTDAIAVSNTRLVEGVDQFLLALAASPVIAGNDLQACARYLQRILALQPTYLNFGVIAPDGRLLCEATGHPASFNLGDRGYFQRALEGGGLVVGDYQVGRVTGRPSIAFARPVMTENGVTKGVVYAALDLQALSDNLRAGRAMPGAAVLLVDAGGIVLASSGGDVAQLGRPLADSGTAPGRRAPPRWAWWSKKRGAEPRYCAPVRPVKAGVGRALYLAVAVSAETVIAPSLRRLHLRPGGYPGHCAGRCGCRMDRRLPAGGASGGAADHGLAPCRGRRLCPGVEPDVHAPARTR
jgi:hypothetical protein